MRALRSAQPLNRNSNSFVSIEPVFQSSEQPCELQGCEGGKGTGEGVSFAYVIAPMKHLLPHKLVKIT
jgi:hypothetical protein